MTLGVICLSFRCQLPNNQIVNDQGLALHIMRLRDTLLESSRVDPTLEVNSVTPERGAKDNRGGFLRQAESEAFLEVFQKRLRASRVRRFSHVNPNLARSQIHISRNSFAHFAKVNWRILHG